jgi:transposase-like protein
MEGSDGQDGMAVSNRKYIAVSAAETGKKQQESWRQILRRSLVQCPRCSEVWLVVGAQENDRYVCKDCGHAFAIKLSPVPTDISQT